MNSYENGKDDEKYQSSKSSYHDPKENTGKSMRSSRGLGAGVWKSMKSYNCPSFKTFKVVHSLEQGIEEREQILFAHFLR